VKSHQSADILGTFRADLADSIIREWTPTTRAGGWNADSPGRFDELRPARL
jgi:hypothetical protein